MPFQSESKSEINQQSKENIRNGLRTLESDFQVLERSLWNINSKQFPGEEEGADYSIPSSGFVILL